MEKPKRSKSLEKHIVTCPHCGGEALDHMTKCPRCGGELTPRGYAPMMTEETQKRVKLITNIVAWGVAIVLIAIILINRFKG